jgi:hypothetical protein
MTIRGILLMSLFLSEMNLCVPLDTAVGKCEKSYNIVQHVSGTFSIR